MLFDDKPLNIDIVVYDQTTKQVNNLNTKTELSADGMVETMLIFNGIILSYMTINNNNNTRRDCFIRVLENDNLLLLLSKTVSSAYWRKSDIVNKSFSWLTSVQAF